MTTGVAAALLDNLTAAAELPALDKETRAGFLRTLYLRSQQLLTEQPAAVRFRVADAANRSDEGLDNGFNQSAPGMGSLMSCSRSWAAWPFSCASAVNGHSSV